MKTLYIKHVNGCFLLLMETLYIRYVNKIYMYRYCIETD